MNIQFFPRIINIFFVLILIGLTAIASPTLAATEYEEFKLLASDGGAGDVFGNPVAISGDTAMVGATGDDDNGDSSGSVYVFTRNPDGDWLENGKLTPSDGSAGDLFGRSIAINGNTAIIGAYRDSPKGQWSGSAYIYERQTDGTWMQVTKLIASDGASFDYFGIAVDLENDTALVGAARGDANDVDTGAVYVFQREQDGSWAQIVKLRANDGAREDRFGESLSLSDNVAVIGALSDDDNGYYSGSAYIFERGSGGEWTQSTKLLASDGAYGDWFGYAVAVSGYTAVVGAYGDDDRGQVSGSAYIFERLADGHWYQVEKLLPDLYGSTGALFGGSVAIDLDRILVGASGQVDLTLQAATGATYSYLRQADDSWAFDLKLLASDRTWDDAFGAAVTLSGDTLLVGAPGNDDNGENSGSAYIFTPLVLEQQVAFDIKPAGCPNPLNVKSRGVLPAAVLGAEVFDVTQIDPATLALEGVAPLRWSYEDVATPYMGDIDGTDAYACTDEGPDGYMDLTLKFDTQAIVEALGTLTDREVRTLTLTGELLDGTPIIGEDVVVILNKSGGKK